MPSANTCLVKYVDEERSYDQEVLSFGGEDGAVSPGEYGWKRKVTVQGWLLKGDYTSVKTETDSMLAAQSLPGQRKYASMRRVSGPWWESRVNISTYGAWEPIVVPSSGEEEEEE